jgi:hypothetical protein
MTNWSHRENALSFDNEQDESVSSEKHEESGYGVDLDVLTACSIVLEKGASRRK